MIEIWKDIKKHKGIYQISNFGNIKSLDRIVKRNKMGSFFKKGEILKPHISKKGYFRIQLSKNNKTKNFLIHKLVANCFLEKPKDKNQINHKDGNKLNNKCSNLEYVTNKENMIHAYKNGLKKPRVKYLIYCEELKLETLGMGKMCLVLKSLGYSKISSSGIYNSFFKNIKHCNLTFKSSKI